MLRLTPALTLMALPLVLTRLISYQKRERPPSSILDPIPEALVLSAFPIAWFFGFLYYTEVPSLLFVVLTVVAASENKHWRAALVCVSTRWSMCEISSFFVDQQLYSSLVWQVVRFGRPT